MKQDLILYALENSLGQLSKLVTGLTDEDFCHKHEPLMQGSIGEHIRHSLDHVFVVLEVALSYEQQRGYLDKDKIYYDRRQRGTALERNRQLCLQTIEQAIDQLRTIKERLGQLNEGEQEISTSIRNFFDQKVEVEHVLDGLGGRSTFSSTLSREFAFIYHHQIHHKASIAIILRLLDLPVSPDFGYAPATLEAMHPA